MEKMIRLAHGAGGVLSHKLHKYIIERLGGQDASALADGAVLGLDEIGAGQGGRLVFTTDSFVIVPRKFPGGDIGKLAVCGTINDLAVMGARPAAISMALVIEEGLETEKLGEYLESAAMVAAECDVRIVTGDTKVVERGSADRLFINTSGIGITEGGNEIGPQMARPGQKILINGNLGDHSIAVVSAREGLSFAGQIESDCAPLSGLIGNVLEAAGGKVKVMRDPTRGGLASVLNEIAGSSRVNIRIDEAEIPVNDKVMGACGLLGYDVFHLANEGKCVFFIEDDAGAVENALQAMHAHPLGRDAAVIGEVEGIVDEGATPRVILKTIIGGRRIIDVLTGDLLPRIC